MPPTNDLIEDVTTKMEEGSCSAQPNPNDGFCSSPAFVSFTQRIIAEAVGTYFLVFAGCGAVTINHIYGGTITFPGIALAFGLIVTVMVYSVGHISGAHFNPAVTITMAFFRHFSSKEVLPYILAQLIGAIFASGTLVLLFDVQEEHYFGTLPNGPYLRSLVMEFLATYLLMFVISGVATDSRAIGHLAGIAIGSTILLDVLIAGSVSGGSMNPARSIGPALIMNQYKGLWIYIVGPVLGAIAGGFSYNLIRQTDKPLRELTKSGSFIKGFSRSSTAR